MGNFCGNCGAELKINKKFCDNCGRQAGLAEQKTVAKFSFKTLFKQYLLWRFRGFLVCIIILSIASIGFMFMQKTGLINNAVAVEKSQDKAVSVEPKAPDNVSQVANNSAISLQKASAVPASKLTSANLNDFRVYVQAKERINSNIIDLASRVNNRIGETGGLKSAQDIRDNANSIIYECERLSSQLSAKEYPPELQGAKGLLLQLFDLELSRVRSLYNGLGEGIAGRDYSSSFSVGTSAAYKFDEVNSKFIQENTSLDTKVVQ